MRRVSSRVALLLVLPLIPAIAAGWLHPRAPAWTSPLLSADEVRLDQALAWGDTVLWLDARSRKNYDAGHIPGALLLNEDHWHDLLPGVLNALPPNAPDARIVVYCDSKGCDASREVATRLRTETQLPNIHILHGGWQAWQEHQRR